MSSQTGTCASTQSQPYGRTKKNSIGSWFSKKFGRRPSEAANGPNEYAYNGATGTNGTVPARTGASRVDGRSKIVTLPNTSDGAQRASVTGQQPQFASAFASDQAHGLANTLTVPVHEGSAHGRLTPPPQLDGIPTQEPLGAIDLPGSTRHHNSSIPTEQNSTPLSLSRSTITNERTRESVPAGNTEPGLHASTDFNVSAAQVPAAAPPIPSANIANEPATTDGIEQDTDNDSSLADRDSIGNRTMDTGKSRASTKPTTLMSLDTREPTVLPTTHIAQPRQSSGDDSFRASQRLSTGPREGFSIHFASDGVSRAGSGQMGNNNNSSSLTAEGASTFINVPTHSRPHPNNNPHPSAIPADNASILTLASSTAGMSMGGASRSHHHAPSLGGARSIGGSLMGDRRNSSDTSASLKALPPLSRRGSDSSSRTRDSIPGSSTGQTSHQAIYAPGVSAGPGAPSDRVSLHRTPSQKTVATQLSIPLSASASNPALQAYARSEHTANGSQLHLPGSQTAHVAAEATDRTEPAEPTEPDAGMGVTASKTGHASEELLKAQASNLAATEHDETLRAAVQPLQGVSNVSEDLGAGTNEEPFDMPGGPPVA